MKQHKTIGQQIKIIGNFMKGQMKSYQGIQKRVIKLIVIITIVIIITIKEQNCHCRKIKPVICRINFRIPFTANELNNAFKKRDGRQ